MKFAMKHLCNDTDREAPTCPSASLFTRNPIRTGLVFNSCLLCEKSGRINLKCV
jgi:hypothetical protein